MKHQNTSQPLEAFLIYSIVFKYEFIITDKKMLSSWTQNTIIIQSHYLCQINIYPSIIFWFSDKEKEYKDENTWYRSSKS